MEIVWADEDISKWIKSIDCEKLKSDFEQNGYLSLDWLIEKSNINVYRHLYDQFLNDEIPTSKHRHDLGSHAGGDTNRENITQIMWPSNYIPNLLNGPIHQKTSLLAKRILGDDMSFDFDMLISKPAGSLTETPWHQDESYWPDLPDKRAVSFWVPLQDVYIENGCMWFVPGSHKLPIRPHKKVKEGHHVNMCECEQDEGRPIPLPAGGCTGHHGRTLHYTAGNNSAECRRAFIVNYRPKNMVEFERNIGYDHGLKGLDGIIERGVK